jgi:hypothetical protein
VTGVATHCGERDISEPVMAAKVANDPSCSGFGKEDTAPNPSLWTMEHDRPGVLARAADAQAVG